MKTRKSSAWIGASFFNNIGPKQTLDVHGDRVWGRILYALTTGITERKRRSLGSGRIARRKRHPSVTAISTS
jgi:hypothetical protein